MSNRKAAGENGELSRQLEEVDQHVSQLHKLRHQLNSQLEDVKKTYEEEAKERQSLLGRLVTKIGRNTYVFKVFYSENCAIHAYKVFYSEFVQN